MLRLSSILLANLILVLLFQCTVSNALINSGNLGTVLLVNSHDFTADEIALIDTFGEVSTVAGPVAVLHTIDANLERVQMLPFVSRTVRPHHLTVELDKSVPDLGASLVWQDAKDEYGRNVTGKGVIVGFVDTGIDITHPDFRHPNGDSKILYVWDQTIQGRPPVEFTYGYECSSIDIQNEICPEVDTFGHGTHTAGIAASSGQANGNYTGVAPGADIIFVKSGYQTCNGSSWNFDDARILDGINYIIKKSHNLGRRAVINLSLGGNIGGHDGADPLEQALDAFVRDGTPIVVAAGNEAATNTHVHGKLKNNQTVTIPIEVKSNTRTLQIDTWFSKQDRINASLISPDGQTYLTKHGTNRISVTGNISGTTALSTLGQETYFEISSSSSIPEVGWNIRLTPQEIQNGTWDSWVDAESCSSQAAFFLGGEGYAIDHNDTISIPGTAHNVVTVGAYVTKTKWLGSNGNPYSAPGTRYGQIAAFSSLGPTRDGRIKPDIVAPGMFIASARLHLVPAASNDPDQFHRVLAGTSMAAPHVAGVIALMLQYSPLFPAMQTVTFLRETAREDLLTGLLPPQGSHSWGSGKADARTATAFYRLSLASLEIPSSIISRIGINDNEISLIGSSWFDEYFPRGSVHRISIAKETTGETDVRYLIDEANFTVSTNSIKILTFKEQYSVNVISSLGTANGSRWVDANSSISVEGSSHLNTNGYVSMLGGRYTLVGWLTGDKMIASGEKTTVEHPITLTALYILTYPPEETIVIIAVSLLILPILRLYNRRSTQNRKTDQSLTNHQT